ncbi:hypothetical protein BDV10DRAFT_29564 [Aspergillus recurvatus]
MRICVLQSSHQPYKHSHAQDGPIMLDLQSLTSQHIFVHRFIQEDIMCGDNSSKEINAVVSEGYDFYLNFLTDSESCRYFESLTLPSACGLSWEKLQRADTLDGPAGASRNSEYDHSGKAYTIAVIELSNEFAIALNPCATELPTQIATPVEQHEGPKLLAHLQQEALRTFFKVRIGHESRTGGCTVNFRVRDGQVMSTSVHSLLRVFLTKELIHGLPGGLPALINILIARETLKSGNSNSRKLPELAAAYNSVAPVYDADGQLYSADETNFQAIVDDFDFRGTVLDLACGTGYFGRVLRACTQRRHRKPETENGTETQTDRGLVIIGSDISPGMVEICRKTGVYNEVHVGRIQTFFSDYYDSAVAGQIDHIVCFGAVYLLTTEELAFMLVSCFAAAGKTVTIGVDEVPSAYSNYMDQLDMPYLRGTNHVAQMDAMFAKPPGWRLVSRQRRFSWTTPDGGDVYATFYRFERIVGERKMLLLSRGAGGCHFNGVVV